jgi:phage/plasmid-associated DNA primase
VGKKLVVAAENESNEKMKIKTETLKQLSGDDLMRVEKKYKDAYTDKLKVELLFATNSDNLVFEDISQGLKRRITVIETEGVVKQKIFDFSNKIEAEIPDIMTKLIFSFNDIVDNGFKLPLCESVVKATEKVINQSINEGVKVSVGEDFLNFFEENFEYHQDSRITKKEAYQKYKENGGKESTTKFWIRFDKWIAHKNYKVTKTNPPNREVIGLKFVDNKLESNELENLF